MERKDIPQNLKWKIEDLYATQQDWDKAYEKVENEYKNLDFTPFKGKLDDRATLLKCLTYIDTLSAEIEKVFLYAHMRQHEDMRNAENAANLSKTLGLYSKMFAEFSFVEPELTSYSDEYLLSLIKDESFKEYDYRLQKILKIQSARAFGKGREIVGARKRSARRFPKYLLYARQRQLKLAQGKV